MQKSFSDIFNILEWCVFEVKKTTFQKYFQKTKKESKEEDLRAVEDFVNHVTRSPDDEKSGPESELKVTCPLCAQKFTTQSKYTEHVEDIHMSWIPPENGKTGNGNVETENLEFPIVPFSSVPDKSANPNNDMEPWRKKYAKEMGYGVSLEILENCFFVKIGIFEISKIFVRIIILIIILIIFQNLIILIIS